MNRDDIIRMAREAADVATDERGREFFEFDEYDLERFAALVAAAEREACQRVHDLLEAHQAALEASEKPGPWPSKEVIDKAVAAEREAAEKAVEQLNRLSSEYRKEAHIFGDSIRTAVAAEREACALMAEECVDIERLAAAIRARGEG